MPQINEVSWVFNFYFFIFILLLLVSNSHGYFFSFKPIKNFNSIFKFSV